MKNYKYILFDLDGTLVESSEGIINSAVYALNKFDISIKDKNQLRSFIGPPLFDSFSSFFNNDKEKTNLAVSYFRENYERQGVLENCLFDGGSH